MAAALLITTVGSFPFLAARTDDGRIPETPQGQLEEISVPGVDYARYRLARYAYPPFRLRTLAEFATWDVGVQAAVQYTNCNGLLANLSMSLQGQSYTWQKVLVIETRPLLRPGKVIGSGATGTGLAWIACDWTLVLTQPRS